MPKWTTSHTFIVIVGCVMAVLAYLAKDPATASWAAPALGVLTALLGYLGLTSGQAFGKPRVPPVGPAILLLVGIGVYQCQAVAPSAQLGACVATGAAKGETVAEIAFDCSADLAAVIAALVQSADPAVKSSAAYTEATKIKAAHP